MLPSVLDSVSAGAGTPLTLAGLRDAYLAVHGNGTLEESTLSTIRQHFRHLASTLPASPPCYEWASSRISAKRSPSAFQDSRSWPNLRISSSTTGNFWSVVMG